MSKDCGLCDGHDHSEEEDYKSALTQMLAAHPDLRHFHDVFAAVPRKPKGRPETPPIETLAVPRGIDFWMQVFMYTVCGLIIAYFITIVIGLFSNGLNVLAGSCAQDVWKVSQDEACKSLIMKTLSVNLDSRCFSDKPANMTDSDFKGVCGDNTHTIVMFVLTLCYVAYSIYGGVMKLPTQVHFHPDFFTVESWNGNNFQGSYYADVTDAANATSGLTISTKARIDLEAGGGDESNEDECDGCFDEKKKGFVMWISGDENITVLSGHGKEQNEFLLVFAKYLSVPIEGFEGDATPLESISRDESILDGRLQVILDARDDDSQCNSVRMPCTADLTITIFLYFIVGFLFFYLFALIGNTIGYFTNKGQDKCVDPLRPGVDLCDWTRIFLPLEWPLVNPGDWVSLIIGLASLISFPTYAVVNLPFEYKFHQNGVVQEETLAGWECQTSKMVFADNMEGAETVKGFYEPCIKVSVDTLFEITGGIEKPFKIIAKFIPDKFKMMLMDERLAACSCQKQQAEEYNDRLEGSFLKVMNATKVHNYGEE